MENTCASLGLTLVLCVHACPFSKMFALSSIRFRDGNSVEPAVALRVCTVALIRERFSLAVLRASPSASTAMISLMGSTALNPELSSPIPDHDLPRMSTRTRTHPVPRMPLGKLAMRNVRCELARGMIYELMSLVALSHPGH